MWRVSIFLYKVFPFFAKRKIGMMYLLIGDVFSYIIQLTVGVADTPAPSLPSESPLREIVAVDPT